MTIRARDLVEDLEPFSDDIRIMVRNAQGNLIAVKGIHYEMHSTRDEAVIVLETERSKRGRRT